MMLDDSLGGKYENGTSRYCAEYKLIIRLIFDMFKAAIGYRGLNISVSNNVILTGEISFYAK